MIEWIIGVLKSGAAYAVADQSHPADRTRAVIAIAKPALVIDDGKGKSVNDLVAGFDTQVLDVGSTSMDEMPTNNLENITQDDDLAYVVFTSGSTGEDLFLFI